MHSLLYTPDPRLRGTAYGFFDWSDNGQRTLGHSGYAPPMHSVLLLLPDQHLGVFVIYNSMGGGELTMQHAGFQRAFFDHYYPAPPVAPIQPPANFAPRASRFVGSYNAYRAYTTLIKTSALFGGGYTVDISNPGDGTLLLNIEGFKLRVAEAAPLYFRQVDGPFSVVFREDERGRITQMSTDLMPQYAIAKLDWYETPGFNMALLVGCVLIFLSMIPVAAIRWIWDRRMSRERNPPARGARVARWIIGAISVLNLLVVGGMMWGAMGGMQNELLDPPMIIKIALGGGVLAAVLTLGALVYTLLAWKNSYWGIAFRVYYTLVTVAAVAFVWFLNYWNMLGWRF
jgi:hypothetical protein